MLLPISEGKNSSSGLLRRLGREWKWLASIVDGELEFDMEGVMLLIINDEFGYGTKNELRNNWMGVESRAAGSDEKR